METKAEVYLPLSQGKVAVIDFDDYEKVRGLKWSALPSKNTCYAHRGPGVLLHRFLLDPPLGHEVDHIDGDGLNNRRSNLRLATHAQNGQNRRKQKSSSRYKGVYWYRGYSKWRAQISFGGRDIYLGYFQIEEHAARAYDVAALEYFGEFARLNFSTQKENQ